MAGSKPYDSNKSQFRNIPKRLKGNATQREFINNLKNTGSSGQYAWEYDPINLEKARQATGLPFEANPFTYTGGNANTGDYEGTDFNNPLAKWNMSTNNQYGDFQFGSNNKQPWYTGKSSERDALKQPGMLSKIGDYIGDNPMDVANLGLNIWGAYNQNKALGQNQQYLDDVRKAMVFDQADVNRRWDLAMGDYRVTQEDQNQHRAAQGMKNEYANV
jgi:hypothetical protein